MEDLVSIIIPAYNREVLIKDALDSIISQTHSSWECLVIDDGSKDNTEQIVLQYSQKDKRIKYYSRPNSKLKGANVCRNYGLKLSKGSYITWFDSDDIMHPDKIKLQKESLTRSNNFFTVCKSYVFEDDIKNVIKTYTTNIFSSQPFEDFLQKNMVILTPDVMFKRDFLIKNSFLFDESLQAGQEWEFFSRILFDFPEFNVLDKPLNYCRKHDNSFTKVSNSKRQWHYFLARYKIYKRFKTKLTQESAFFLRRYFLLSFKQFLRQLEYKRALNIWKMVMLSDKTYSIKQHFFLGLSFFSFLIFGKGDIFLTKVHLWSE